MPKSIEPVKLNGPAPMAASAKRIALRSAAAPTTRGATTPSLKKKIVPPDNSLLEWYVLTENTMHVLNAVITKNSREQIAESNKTNPDQKKISELKSKIYRAIEITRDHKNFESKTRMQEIIQEYGK